MESDDVFPKLIDSILKDFAETGIPQNPRTLAGILAETFCRGFSEPLRREYTQQIEDFIRARMFQFVAEQERARSDAGQN